MSKETGAVPIRIDWPEFYSEALGDGGDGRRAIAAARRIERDMLLEGWPVGRIFADRRELSRRYGFGHATLIETARLLEGRGVARMRRGPGGGLLVLSVARSPVVSALCDYFAGCGVTAEQLREARLALGIVADYVRSVAEGPGATERFDAAFREALHAGDEGDPLAKSRSALSGRNRIESDDPFVRLFADSLDHFADPWGASENSRPIACRAAASPKQTLAGQIAELLETELRARSAPCGGRIGTEAEMSARFGVSRHVLRQAIRVLEAHGVVESRRGRTYGIRRAKPRAIVAVEPVVSLFSSMALTAERVQPARQMMGRLVRVLVAAQSNPSQQQEFMRFAERGRAWGGTAIFKDWQELDWAIVNNPIICVMSQALTGYRVRLSEDSCSIPVGGSPALQRSLREHLLAGMAGDLAGADRHFEELSKQVRASFHPA